ncbi:hypothetical protein BH20ACI1_BH20ACI1_25220 [soil metagenome]
MSANENQLQIEVLQPEISSQIQKATSEELKNWIKDGKLKPNHQVRIKNLNWIEAHKIPAFQALFESKKSEPNTQSNHFNNQTISNASALKLSKPKTDEAAEKTNIVLGSLVSSSSSTSENTKQENTKPNPADEARKELEKQQLIKVFIFSFLIIFGLQMLTRLFSKDQ